MSESVRRSFSHGDDHRGAGEVVLSTGGEDLRPATGRDGAQARSLSAVLSTSEPECRVR
ncbi:MAG: hypothetical protein AVDCRST_MAG67-1245 [uncultured Solirubrobacteraceae bacterium]|uniref:Uncharacterized protein n=1 Tax=uncultured Solirubrobacteraceae bacterium TaxID=1162706 RepID=A0A6J4SCZ0_9ACTN|nr:MAG: hypothetical protein AVDCRST_MAG67-1245 [uncultured Solirubrobacteraceae bacterium]